MAIYLTGRRPLPLILAVEIGEFPYPHSSCLGNPNLVCELARSRWRVGFGFGMVRFGSTVYARGMKKIWS